MKKLSAVILSLFCMSTALADSRKNSPKAGDAQPAVNTAVPNATPVKTNAEITVEMEELRRELQSQKEELRLLKEELANHPRQIEGGWESAASANSNATEATIKASETAAISTEVKTTAAVSGPSITHLAASNAVASSVAGGSRPAGGAAAGNPVATSGQNDEEKGPLTIRFKGISITPGGFIAAETVNRQRALSDDINTQFNAIPFSGNSVGKLTEFNATARQSRLSLMGEGKLGDTKISGYYEADWLGAGVTSNNRQSNSYVFRQRQIWGRAAFANGWSFIGGQQWSLATESKKGIINLNEWIPLTIDPQYVVGFSWARQYSARVVKNFSDKFAIALSAENPEATVGGRGFSTYTNTSATGTVTTFQNSFVFAPGAGGGLQNSVDSTGYSLNKTPDFILKAAADPGFGHYEVFGIISTFQHRVYPCAVVGTTTKNFPTPTTPVTLGCAPFSTSLSPNTAGAYNNTSTGGGVGGSSAFSAHNRVDFGLKAFWGDGEGRYGSAQLADATLRPDGTMSLIHGGHWLGRIEWHATPKLDVYAYIGGEYAARTAYTGYQTVKVTNTPAIPGCGAVGEQPCAGGGIQPGYPALVTTTVVTNGIGGYGSPSSNNSGCSIETLPSATGTPGTGGTCAGDTRYIQENTIGFWYKFYQGEKGRVQFGMQYSYFWRNAWSGNGGLTAGSAGIASHAVDNMIWTSFRYYLP